MYHAPMRATAIPAVLLVALASPAHAVTDRSADKNSAALITELVTTALGKDPRFDVVSSADLRRQLDVESNKQAVGCDASSTSCLAELAGAMGAQLVVTGKLGTLDDVVILTLSLFDSKAGKAVGRVAVRAASLGKVSDKVDGAVVELVSSYRSAEQGDIKAKLLVLDVEPPRADDDTSGGILGSVTVASPPVSDAVELQRTFGVIALAGGVVVGGVGGLFYLVADDANKRAATTSLDAISANARYDERDVYGSLSVAGVVVGVTGVVAGIALLVSASDAATTADSSAPAPGAM